MWLKNLEVYKSLLYTTWTKWINRDSVQPELEHDRKHFDSLTFASHTAKVKNDGAHQTDGVQQQDALK